MNLHDKYLAKVEEVICSVEHVLNNSEMAEVKRLADHGEPAESLSLIAALLVQENKKVPAQVVFKIRELTAGLLQPDELPSDLDLQIEH